MPIDPTQYTIYTGPSIDDAILSGKVQTQSVTQQDLISYKQLNNIPADAVQITTAIGGVVWVSPTAVETINAYQTGLLTGGFKEVAADGVYLRVLPSLVNQPVTETINTEMGTIDNNISLNITAQPSPSRPVTPANVQKNKINFKVSIVIEILRKKEREVFTTPITIDISPSPASSQNKFIGTLSTGLTTTISTFPIPVNVSIPLIDSAFAFLTEVFETYVDEDRQLKTLLNYGEDRQTVALAYRNGPLDDNGIQTIQVKLLDPIPTQIGINSNVFLSREVAKSTIDKVRIKFAPEIDTTPYLRPKNLSAKSNLDLGKSVNNLTLKQLQLNSGSVGIEDLYKNISFEDNIFRRWYTEDFNSVELNTDFSDYKNFIFYSSAAMRLSAFKEKLKQIQKLDEVRLQFLSSSTYIGNITSSGFVFVQQKTAEYSKQTEDIIRSFDIYERYLYFTPSGSSAPYSASFDYVDDSIEYNQYGYWPKSSSGSLYSVYSPEAISWYNTQLSIAQRYDQFNENNLIYTIPSYLLEDENSSAYVTFVSMVGHFFDNIKPYIDQMSYIWSRNLDPEKELSVDLINEIAESLGFTLPSIDSTYNITDDVLGTENEVPRRILTAEIYKRLLHNLPFFAKAKGTKTALDAFLRSFGITPQLISVKESGTPVTSSYYVYDEFSNSLDFDSSKIQYISVPIVATSRQPRVMLFNCVVGKSSTMTVVTGDDKWALNVSPHPSNPSIGRFELTSGSSQTTILSSSYHEIYNDIPITVAIDVANTVSTLKLIQVEGEDVVFTSTMAEQANFYNLWNSTQFAYIGGTGPLVVNRFEGYVDELRLWNDNLSSRAILNYAFDPGTSAGDTYESAADHLLVQLSFNNINNELLIASSSINNETPYKNKLVAPSLANIFLFNVSGSDFSRYNRTIRQEMLQGGSSGITTLKTKIAPPPTFINSTSGLRLYKNKSIVEPSVKRFVKGSNKIILATSPTDVVNQNIIRSLGSENISALYGASTDVSLNLLKKYYQTHYNVIVNKNKFIRLMSNLSEVLDQSVDYFVPVRGKVLKGVTIEQNVLEQVRIKPIKNIKFYGKNTRRTLTAANSRSGSAPDYGATFNLQDTIRLDQNNKTFGKFNTFTTNAHHSLQFPYAVVVGNTSLLSSSINNPALELEVSLTKLNSRISINPSTPIETVNKLTSKLNGLVNTISSSISNLKTVVEKHPTELNASISNHKTNLHITPKEIIGVDNTYLSNIDVIPVFTASNQTYNTTVDANPILTGSYPVYFSTIAVEESSTSEMKSYTLKHIANNLKNIYKQLSGSRLASSADVGLSNMNKIPYVSLNNGSEGAEPYKRVYPRKLFPFEINKIRNGGSASLYIPALYDIPPSADFRDMGVYTYFNKSNGIYYFSEYMKTPKYFNELNQPWSEVSQSFVSSSRWSYGGRYNINDVVYQNIDASYIPQLGEAGVRSALAGNGIYYVFKTKPAYKSPMNKTSFYSGSVPSYTPPSLDKKNWESLRFSPSVKLVPKRVVFDIYSNSNLSQTNFKTTTIPVERTIDDPARYLDVFDITSIPANSYVIGEFLVQNIATLFAIQSNFSGLRMRLYRTPQTRDADLSRPSNVRPQNSHGVLLDMEITSDNTAIFTNPITTLVADATPPSGKLYYTINNLDSTDKIFISMLLYYFAVQIEPKIPIGYLRKHYRFFRDNSTATKRRNYVGCKNSIDSTFDGLPPVQIFLSEGTSITVANTTTNTEISTGGGGQLNVT